ncbi:Conserved_hypothetical protein [Hexamita inflata]|uniref:Myb-like domain-containing protein n=1 Tax=Hexamita inflata TaxID=28002 RepID=A0AA86NYE1_9EUKA|nr:Conserved hypothetical protein [Hexamita inflata]
MRTRIYDKWTQSDRDLLLQLVQQHCKKGKIDWKAISDTMQTRTTRQYIQLFKQDESGQRHQWTSAEELLLMQSFQQNPFDWKNIQQHFQQVTIKQLKNKYNQLTRNQKYLLFPNDSESEQILKQNGSTFKNSAEMLSQNDQTKKNKPEKREKETQKNEKLGELAQLLSQHLDL